MLELIPYKHFSTFCFKMNDKYTFNDNRTLRSICLVSHKVLVSDIVFFNFDKVIDLQKQNIPAYLSAAAIGALTWGESPALHTTKCALI